MPNFFDVSRLHPKIGCSYEEYFYYEDIAARRLWFNTAVENRTESSSSGVLDCTTLLVTDMVHHIIQYNRDDAGIPIEERDPIKLYINSPGGDKYEGFSLIDAILVSDTPVWTYNVGMCASMGFLIYIAGKKRFTFPHSMFLHHDGTNGGWGSSNKFIDTAEFDKRYDLEVVKKHVLTHTKISEAVYEEYKRVEWYMLPKEAIELGIADAVVESMSEVL